MTRLLCRSRFVALTLAALVAASGAWAAPLPLEGKTLLYQRVISVPGARLYEAIEVERPASRALRPFTALYVYERRTVGDRTWLRVGTGTVEPEGWVDSARSVEWRQALTVGFRDPEKSPRVVLFDSRAPIIDLLERQDGEGYEALRRQAIAGENAPGVAAVQPEAFVNVRRNFYLVPILRHEDVVVGTEPARLLEVASVPLRDPTRDFTAAVVFVIDTTVSMGPYIERSRQVMRRIYEAIEESDRGDTVSYGVVAFRDNTEAVPGLDYVAEVVVDLDAGRDGAEFLRRTGSVKAATVSSAGFNEDAYAGIERAIRGIDWSGYFARHVVLITDAGPRGGDDALGATGLDTQALRRLAQDSDISVTVLHLKTPAGVSNHASAEAEYRALSRIDGIGEFYVGVSTGDVDAFETALQTLTGQLTNLVVDVGVAAAPEHPASSELTALSDNVGQLGYALRMRYLAQHEGSVAPNVFDGWLVDRDFGDPTERAVDVRVLLTRNQLSDLHQVLRAVLNAAQEGVLAPADFLSDLKSLAATMSRDPEAARRATRTVGSQSLADLGYMREYLDGLPYQSEVMTLDLSSWQSWSAQRQFEYVNGLEGKVAYYEALHDNVDLWVPLDGGDVSGDAVYPLLLEALP